MIVFFLSLIYFGRFFVRSNLSSLFLTVNVQGDDATVEVKPRTDKVKLNEDSLSDLRYKQVRSKDSDVSRCRYMRFERGGSVHASLAA